MFVVVRCEREKKGLTEKTQKQGKKRKKRNSSGPTTFNSFNYFSLLPNAFFTTLHHCSPPLHTAFSPLVKLNGKKNEIKQNSLLFTAVKFALEAIFTLKMCEFVQRLRGLTRARVSTVEQ